VTDRIRTLLLYANGATWKFISVDTVLRGLLGFEAERALPRGWLRHPLVRTLVGARYEALSYVNDWQEAFSESPQLDVHACSTTNLVEYRRCMRRIADYDLVVVLHSAAGDSMSLLRRTAHWFERRRGRLLVFLGNEYDLMPEKIGFVRSVGAEFVASQLPIAAARWLYEECAGTRVLAAPHALNPRLYRRDEDVQRVTDIGFIGDVYPLFIGDVERNGMIRFFQDHAAELGVTCDIRLERLSRFEWARFLNQCRGVIGAEAGTYYLERTDQTANAVKAFLARHPAAPFEEVFERFFRDYPDPRSGKAISSRHFEPVGTRTCQILLEGGYNGILHPDEHYISIRKDYANVPDAIARFRDSEYRAAMTARTCEYVLAGHTYAHRVAALLSDVLGTDSARTDADAAA
jgi:hypothetical protein